VLPSKAARSFSACACVCLWSWPRSSSEKEWSVKRAAEISPRGWRTGAAPCLEQLVGVRQADLAQAVLVVVGSSSSSACAPLPSAAPATAVSSSVMKYWRLNSSVTGSRWRSVSSSLTISASTVCWRNTICRQGSPS
jgi:hypothetical protein